MCLASLCQQNMYKMNTPIEMSLLSDFGTLFLFDASKIFVCPQFRSILFFIAFD